MGCQCYSYGLPQFSLLCGSTPAPGPFVSTGPLTLENASGRSSSAGAQQAWRSVLRSRIKKKQRSRAARGWGDSKATEFGGSRALPDCQPPRIVP